MPENHPTVLKFNFIFSLALYSHALQGRASNEKGGFVNFLSHTNHNFSHITLLFKITKHVVIFITKLVMHV